MSVDSWKGTRHMSLTQFWLSWGPTVFKGQCDTFRHTRTNEDGSTTVTLRHNGDDPVTGIKHGDPIMVTQ